MAVKNTKKQAVPSKTVKTPVSDSPKDPSAQTRWIIAGLLAGFAFLLYANTLGHGFVLDDPLVTTLNAYVKKGFGGLGDIFTHSYRAGSSVSTDSEYMYRPLSVALFAVEWAIAPNKPGVHHCMNLLWYACTAGLLFLTLSKLLNNKHLWLAIGATALFVAHPIHTEVIANIKSRDEILSLFFSLLCLNYYWEYTQTNTGKYLWLALGAFFLALLSKEGAVTMLVIIPMAIYFFDPKRTLGQVVQVSAWLLIPVVIWFLLRAGIMNGKMAYTPNINDNQLVAATLMERWATSFVVLGKYLQLLVWPATLSWDYSFNSIPTTNWGDWKAWVSLAIHAGMLVVGVRLFRQRSLWSFCILAYGASMLLYSNLFLLIGAIIGERLTYVASVWYCLALAYGLVSLLRVPAVSDSPILVSKESKLFAAVLGFIVLGLSVRTFVRSGDWASDFSLFTADSQNAPNSFRAQRGAGEQLLIEYNKSKTPEMLEQAEVAYRRSLEIKPTEYSWVGLGTAAYIRKDIPKALEYFKEGLKLAPNDQSIKSKIVNVYREMGETAGKVNNDLPQAITYFKSALAIDSTDSGSLVQMGTAYGMQNLHREAVGCFEKALRKTPNDKGLLSNLSVGYRLLGDAAKSEEYARRAAAAVK